MARILRNAVFVVLVSLLAGIGIAVYRIATIKQSAAFEKYGSWRGTSNLPLNRNNLVTTQVTLFALFALPSNEAVYLFATDDDKQERLNGSNTYIIEGNVKNIKSAYWSITAYGKDLYLLPNGENRYSFNGQNVIADSLGNFKITVSSEKSEGNWLPVIKNEKFELVLRLYQNDKDFLKNMKGQDLPVIKRI